MRGVPWDVDECREYGRAPFPTKVLYAELRGRSIHWGPGETAADAVHRAALRRRIRRTVAEVGEDLAAALEHELAQLGEDEGGEGGVLTFVPLPPSVQRRREARDALRAAARARVAARRPPPQGGLTEAERKDKMRHPEKYADRPAGKPGRPRRDTDVPGETRDTTRDSAPPDVTGFGAGQTRVPPSPPFRKLSLSGSPEGGPGEGERDPDPGAPSRDSDPPVSRVVPPAPPLVLRTADELAAMDPEALGQLLVDVLRQHAPPECFALDCNEQMLTDVGRVIAAARPRVSGLDLRAIATRAKQDPEARKRVLHWDHPVRKGARVKVSLLRGKWRGSAYEGKAFNDLLGDAREWLAEVVKATPRVSVDGVALRLVDGLVVAADGPSTVRVVDPLPTARRDAG